MSNNQKLVKVKRNTKSLIMKNLIVLAVIVVIALTGALSWFTNQTTATADGINVVCETPDGLEIAIVQHGAPVPSDNDYKEGEITLKKEDFPFLTEQSIVEITSDGTDFYKPKLTQVNGKAIPDTDAIWDVADVDSYLSLDIYMRTKETHTVYLNSATKVNPISTQLVGENAGNKSDDGDFSKDCIVGAVRVSTVNKENSNLKNLWIPAPQIHYDGGKVSINNTSGVSFTHKYWEVNKNEDNKTGTPVGTNTYENVIINNVIINGDYNFTLGENHKFAVLAKTNDSEYATGMTTVNIWVDGEDDEARLAMVGGKFEAVIKLSI